MHESRLPNAIGRIQRSNRRKQSALRLRWNHEEKICATPPDIPRVPQVRGARYNAHRFPRGISYAGGNHGSQRLCAFPEALVVRGGLARTFGSLASFLAVSFLFCGLYLLADAFEHPLDAGPVSIFAAALAITLATILFYYLLKPRHAQKAAVLTTQARGIAEKYFSSRMAR